VKTTRARRSTRPIDHSLPSSLLRRVNRKQHGGPGATGNDAERGGIERGRRLLYHRLDHADPRKRLASGNTLHGQIHRGERCQGQVLPGSRRCTLPLRVGLPA